MKKIMLILVVLSVVLMGCPGPTDEVVVESPFEGTWLQLSYPNTLYFTGSNFRYTQRLTGIDYSGSFTFTETTITFNPTEGWEWDESYIPWTANYEINGNRLWIERLQAYDGSWYSIGGLAYIKQ